MAAKRIVVDGANVAYEEKTRDGKPKTSNIANVVSALKESGYQPIVIVDASLRHDIDDPDQLEKMIDDQMVRQVPAGTDADYFVLETAKQLDADVLSNDRYQPYQESFPWIKDRRLPLMIVNGHVELYREDMKKSA